MTGKGEGGSKRLALCWGQKSRRHLDKHKACNMRSVVFWSIKDCVIIPLAWVALVLGKEDISPQVYRDTYVQSYSHIEHGGFVRIAWQTRLKTVFSSRWLHLVLSWHVASASFPRPQTARLSLAARALGFLLLYRYVGTLWIIPVCECAAAGCQCLTLCPGANAWLVSKCVGGVVNLWCNSFRRCDPLLYLWAPTRRRPANERQMVGRYNNNTSTSYTMSRLVCRILLDMTKFAMCRSR